MLSHLLFKGFHVVQFFEYLGSKWSQKRKFGRQKSKCLHWP